MLSASRHSTGILCGIKASHYAEFKPSYPGREIVSNKKGNKERSHVWYPLGSISQRCSSPLPITLPFPHPAQEAPIKPNHQTKTNSKPSTGPLRGSFKAQFSGHATPPRRPRPPNLPQRTHLSHVPIPNFPPAQHLPNLLAPPQHPFAASPGSACPTLVPASSPTIQPKDSPRRARRIGDFTPDGRIRKRYCLRHRARGGLPLRDHGRAPLSPPRPPGAATRTGSGLPRSVPRSGPAPTCWDSAPATAYLAHGHPGRPCATNGLQCC